MFRFLSRCHSIAIGVEGQRRCSSCHSASFQQQNTYFRTARSFWRRHASAVLQVEFHVLLCGSRRSSQLGSPCCHRQLMLPRFSMKRAPSGESMCRHAAEASCSSGRFHPILPEESLPSRRCATHKDQVKPIGNTHHGCTSRDLRNGIPSCYIELWCGERRHREKGRVHLGVLILSKQFFLSTAAANIAGLSPPESGDVLMLPRRSVETSRTGRRGLKCTIDRRAVGVSLRLSSPTDRSFPLDTW